MRRRYFPRASEALAAACVLALGLANMMPVLLRRPGFREIPITCGYACCMVALAAIFQGLHARRPRRWLALAGLALGCAVGSRPHYLLVCPVAFLPAWLDARERGLGRACWRDRDWRKLAWAPTLPLAIIGLGLALYNYLRFGNPVEFGIRYQLWFADPSKLQHFAWRYLAYNLQTYWLAPAGWTRYFPFVTFIRLPDQPAGFYGAEDPYGILPNMPFALFALAAGALWARGPSRPASRLRVFAAGVVLVAGVMSLTVSLFHASLNRYMVDFAPAVVPPGLPEPARIGRAAVVSGAPPRRSAPRSPAGSPSTRPGASVMSWASLRHNELFRAEHPALYSRLAHRWNWLSYEYDRWRGTRYGPLEMQVTFPPDRTGASEPLVVTGRAFLSDFLFVHYVAARKLGPVRRRTHQPWQFSWPGRPGGARAGIRSGLISAPLYPPAAHPYFDAMLGRSATAAGNGPGDAWMATWSWTAPSPATTPRAPRRPSGRPGTARALGSPFLRPDRFPGAGCREQRWISSGAALAPCAAN